MSAIDAIIAKHTQEPALTISAPEITLADCEAYVAAKDLHWLTGAAVLANKRMHNKVAAFIYAGPNPMAHHDASVEHGGLHGAMQVFIGLIDPAPAKVAAGSYLTSAREYRARGEMKLAAGCLEQAAHWRKVARDRSAPKHQSQHLSDLAAE